MKLREIIKKEGTEIVLYSESGKVLGRFPFGEGKEYESEEDARAAARKQSGLVQFFKQKAEAAGVSPELAEACAVKHSAKWKSCFEQVKAKRGARSAAAICTAALGESLREAPEEGEEPGTVVLSRDDLWAAVPELAAEMELAGMEALKIDLETWEIGEIPAGDEEAWSAGATEEAGETPRIALLRLTARLNVLRETPAGEPLREQEGVSEILDKWGQMAGSVESCVAVLDGLEGISDAAAVCNSLHGVEGETPPAEDVEVVAEEARRVLATLQEIGARHTTAEIALLEKIIRFLEIIKDGVVTKEEAEELKALGIRVRPTAAEEEGAEEEEPAAEALREQEAGQEGGESFEERSRRIWDAWRELYPWTDEGPPPPEIVATFEEYVIARDQEGMFRVSYTIGEEGSFEFAPRGEWVAGTMQFVPEGSEPVGEEEPAEEPPAEEAPAGEEPAEEPAAEAIQESVPLVATGRLVEAQVAEDNTVPCVLIEAGESANGNVYEDAVLQSAAPLFAGAPMFIDHPTRSEERERPERSVRDLAGRLSEEVVFSDGALRSRARISNNAGWLRTLIQEGIGGDLSINAVGKGRREEGKFFVEAITAVKSVDFVTQAAARGRIIAAMEAARLAEIPWEAVTVELLAERRPELLNAVRSQEKDKLYRGREEVLQLAEEATALREQVGTQQKRIEELEAEAEARAVAEIVDDALAESSLPQPAQDAIRKRLAGASLAEIPTLASEAIQEMKTIVGQVLEAGRVRGHGGSASEQESGEQSHADLVEAFLELGYTREQAEIAARGRT